MEETKPCPYCGQEILTTAKKCRFCGKWIEMKCPYCHEWINAEAKKCKHCGEWLDPEMREQSKPVTVIQQVAPSPSQQVTIEDIQNAAEEKEENDYAGCVLGAEEFILGAGMYFAYGWKTVLICGIVIVILMCFRIMRIVICILLCLLWAGVGYGIGGDSITWGIVAGFIALGMHFPMMRKNFS